MKFLICGLGSIGLRHLKNLKLLGYKDIIIYSSGNSVMPGAKEETTGLNVYSSLNEALLEKPDICMITNPTSMHVDIALKVANAGCHLYIEKPVSHSLNDLGKLQEIVNSRNLITFITYQFRFHPHIKLLKSIFQDKHNKYGRPLYVTAEWSEYLPDWHPWEDYKNGFSARSDLGGGVLLTQIHPINYLNYIFGDITKVVVNKAETRALNIQVDDVADLLINFTNDMTGHVHIDFLQKPRIHAMRIVTDSGRFEWDYHQNTLVFKDSNDKQEYFNNDTFERNDMFIEMLENFIECVNLGKRTKFNLDEAIIELEHIL
jgi:predicted dehydrogenase